MLGRIFKKFTDVSLKDARKMQRVARKSFVIFSVSFAVVVFALIMIKFSILASNKSVVETMAQKMQDKNVKIAVISKGEVDCLSHEYFIGVKQESESMGVKVDTFVANYDLASFRYLLVQAGRENYDGVIIDGGDGEVVEEIKELVSKGISVVAFDSTSELSKIKGITMTSQDDIQMMEYALANIFKQLNGKGNIVYLYKKTHPSFVARHKVYEQFLIKNAGMNEVERFEVGRTETCKAKNVVAEMLKRHSKGEVDVIFATFGGMARGAAEAIEKSGRNDIKVYTVGFMNTDLYIMREKGSPYVLATGIDLKEIGTVNVRVLLKKIAGKETPSKYEFKPLLVTQDQLRKIDGGMNENSLKKVVRGWGENDDFEEDWMKKLKKSHAEEIIKSIS